MLRRGTVVDHGGARGWEREEDEVSNLTLLGETGKFELRTRPLYELLYISRISYIYMPLLREERGSIHVCAHFLSFVVLESCFWDTA